MSQTILEVFNQIPNAKISIYLSMDVDRPIEIRIETGIHKTIMKTEANDFDVLTALPPLVYRHMQYLKRKK